MHISATPDHQALLPSACFNVKGRLLAFGARWIVDPKDTAAHAVEAADDYGAAYFVIRKQALQYGLFSFDASGAHKPTIFRPWHSVASFLADGIRLPAWMGAWELPDGRWWTVVVNQRKISPDGDMIHESWEDARHFLMDRYSTGGADVRTWRAIYAPSDWGIPNALQDSLAEILVRLGSTKWSLLSFGHPHALRLAVSKTSSLLRVVMSAAVVMAAGGALLYGGSYVYRQHFAPATRPQQATGPVYGPLPHYMPASAVMAGCLQAVAQNWPKAVLSLGWTPTGYDCDGVNLQMRAQADQGVPPQISRTGNPALVPEGGSDRKASVAVPVTVNAAPTEKLPSTSEAELRSFFGRYAETVGGTWVGERIAPPQQQSAAKDAPKVIPRYAVVQWRLETAAPPGIWVDTLARVPDWAVRRIASEGEIWIVEGSSHVVP